MNSKEIKMKVLNLYAGIGGNRKLWEDVEVTAVENNQKIMDFYLDNFDDDYHVGDAKEYLREWFRDFDFIWSSPPCPDNSRAKYWSNKTAGEAYFPNLDLYKIILFLQHWYDGLWVVENVIPYYKPLIPSTAKIGRHLFWANFKIGSFESKDADIKEGNIKEWEDLHGFDTRGWNFGQRKDQILRNCVHPETGLYILDCARNIIRNKTHQKTLF